MEDIDLLYSNNFGMAFTWKKHTEIDIIKVQLVFRNTGMLLSCNELNEFSLHIKKALKNSLNCNTCVLQEKCKSLLLETPAKQISFAMNYKELNEINELVNGAVFNLHFDSILKKNSINKTGN